MNHLYKKFIKISTLCIAGTLLFSLNTIKLNAEIIGERALAGQTKEIDDYYAALEAAETEATLSDGYNYKNIGIAKVDNYLNIRKGPGEDQAIIGKLPKDAGCTILEIDNNGWAKIKSGKVSGYVLSSYLITGSDAVSLAKKIGSLVATVNSSALNVRAEASLLSEKVTSVPSGEELEVIGVDIEWIKVQLDADEGYVSRQFVDLSYELKKAVFDNDTSSLSSTRSKMVAFAKEHLGGDYEWGGTTFSGGVDCSGFMMRIYRDVAGVEIPRTSRSQANYGTVISSSNVKPGDLLFYGSGNYINHVAMYIGDGKVIHASNERSGIKISNMYYRDPIKAVRIIKD